ncbi:hypothetical protein TNCV_2001181 [Trichonephila clavipes]|nr:hypothetical protein TNCV_2001181 [Trichonephila clavipes]
MSHTLTQAGTKRLILISSHPFITSDQTVGPAKISYSRAIGGLPREFEPWLGEDDDSCAAILSPIFLTTPTGYLREPTGLTSSCRFYMVGLQRHMAGTHELSLTNVLVE